MADLDDFFAKKDRKKKSSTKKYATTEEVAKKLEDSAKKPDKGAATAKKERAAAQEGEDVGAPVHEQDEWRDFEEEKKDYSGLKIGNLTINQSSDGNASGNEANSEQQPCYDDSGNEVEKKVAGPWKRVDQESEQAAAAAPQPPPPEEKPPSSTGAYVPPSRLRGQSQPQQMQPSRLRSKVAPDIHNDVSFPTLSGSTKKKNPGDEFEYVAQHKSSSYRHSEQSKMASSQGPKLQLGNRYNSLSNDS